MPILPNLMCSSNEILIKTPAKTCVDLGKLILKSTWTAVGPRRAKVILRNNKVEGITLPDFKTSCRAAVTQTAWDRQEGAHTGQRKEGEPRNRPTRV